MLTKEERKLIAIETMKELDIYKPYIEGFAKNNHVCMFERFGGYWAYQYPELMAKIQEFEQKHDSTVFAVTHEYTAFGECFDFVFVSSYEEEQDNIIFKEDNTFYTYAYVWNKTDEWCSEFGEIGLKSFGGGIARVA